LKAIAKIFSKKSAAWSRALITLFCTSTAVYFITRLIDYLCFTYTTHYPGSNYSLDWMGRLLPSDIGNLTNTLGGLGELVTSVMGIEITVIAIIVQLAANKYSSQIMEIFLENKSNVFIFGIYVITAVNTLLVTNTISQPYIPVVSIGLNFLLIIISLIVVIPHFAYVFNFLRPEQFLGYVKHQMMEKLESMVAVKGGYTEQAKEKMFADINFLGDIALNALGQSDRQVPLLCSSYLRDVLIRYFEIKDDLPKEWFQKTGKEYLDPDFSSYSKYVLESIEDRKIFLERKVFRLYEMLFDNSRTVLRDVASGVLLNSQLIAAGAIQTKQKGALHCAFQYFNSYMRIAIRGHDPRSAFNTLEHYRTVAEKLLDAEPKEVEAIAYYFKYYGQEANKNHILFILETAAHDLCFINEMAYDKQVPNIDSLLYLFLTLDEPIEESEDRDTSSRELSLMGVRIAQTKLATFYITKGDVQRARVIYDDMRIEPLPRIRKIKEMIINTREEEFWEITPRGVNFNFMPPERREAMMEFFSWFEKDTV
jgi:hypothetical protein